MKPRYSEELVITMLQSQRVQDNQLALKQLQTTYESTLAYLKTKCKNHDDAKSIYGSALFDLFNNVKQKSFKQNAKLNTYFQSIVQKKLGKYFRHLKTLKVSCTDLGIEDKDDIYVDNKTPSPEMLLLLKELSHIFKALLKKCSPKSCQVLTYLIAGDTLDEIGEKLGMSRTVVKSTKSRAMKALKNLIQERPHIEQLLSEFYYEIKQSRIS